MRNERASTAVERHALPFTCPACGSFFGFGLAAELLAVVSSLPVVDEPTPCCGARIDGVLERMGETAILRMHRVHVPPGRHRPA
jgi:hypothetical protein